MSEDMDELRPLEPIDILAPDKPQAPRQGRDWTLPVVLVLCIGGLATLSALYFHADSQRDTARKAQHTAEAALKVEKAKPPKVVTKTVTVTKNVPTFGKSVLMGVFAQGVIQAGVFDGNGNQVFTPNDSTCSMEYTQLSNQYTSVTIDRTQFMSACEGSLNLTMKKDTGA